MNDMNETVQVRVAFFLPEGVNISREDQNTIVKTLEVDIGGQVETMREEGTDFHLTQVMNPIGGYWLVLTHEIFKDAVPNCAIYVHDTEEQRNDCYDTIEALANEKWGKPISGPTLH
jgi:hypothetical protein